MGPFWEVRRLCVTRRRGKGRINLPWIWFLELELIFKNALYPRRIRRIVDAARDRRILGVKQMRV